MRVVHSEWTKLRSVRSTWIAAAAPIITAVGISVIGVSGQLAGYASHAPPGWDPTATSLKGLLVAQLIIGVLGALSITSEYSTRMIHTSLAVVPRRVLLLGAKAVVTGACAFVTGLVAAFASFFVVQALLVSAGVPDAALRDPGVLRAVIGAALYLTLIALIGLGLGALMRSTSGALGTLVGITLLVPAVAPALPGAVGEWMARFWPTTAGQGVYAVVRTAGALDPWTGLGILTLCTLYLCVTSQILFRFRDV